MESEITWVTLEAVDQPSEKTAYIYLEYMIIRVWQYVSASLNSYAVCSRKCAQSKY